MALDLDRISLREDERALLTGGTGTGKSTLAELLGLDFTRRYPDGRRLILDSKPRYRPEYRLDGTYAGALYLQWKRGQYVRDAVVVGNARQMRQAFGVGFRTVVVQLGYQGARLRDLLESLRDFYELRRYHRRLGHVDEALDFYGPTGLPRESDDIMNRCARSGREHGLAMLYCSQRTRAFSTTVLEEISRLYAFALDFEADADRYQEFGCPPFDQPAGHDFRYWTKQDRPTVYGPYRLSRQVVRELAA
jgi:ribosomal protein S14